MRVPSSLGCGEASALVHVECEAVLMMVGLGLVRPQPWSWGGDSPLRPAVVGHSRRGAVVLTTQSFLITVTLDQ